MTPRRAWFVGAVTLLALDPVTTAIAVELGLGVEANPLLAGVVEAGNWPALVGVKAAVLGGVYAAWRAAPEGRAHTWVPTYAAAVGTLVVTSNVLMVALSGWFA